eukprot:1503423-Prymnesium_polylepis.1
MHANSCLKLELSRGEQHDAFAVHTIPVGACADSGSAAASTDLLLPRLNRVEMSGRCRRSAAREMRVTCADDSR